MLFKLVKTINGKTTVEMTDVKKKVQSRLTALKNTYRGKKVKFDIEPVDTNIKFRKKPVGYHD